MSILRNPNRDRYTVIHNALLEDDRLSWGAKGLLAYLLSKPDGWQINQAHVENIGTAGRYKVRKLFSELYASGYLEQRQTRDVKGFITGSEVVLVETPSAENRNAVKPEGQKTGMSENRRQVNTDNKQILNTVTTEQPIKGSRECPEDFVPSEKTVRSIQKHHPDLTPDDFNRGLIAMKAHVFKKPIKDWNAAFRNWMNNQVAFGKTGASNGHRKSTVDAKREALARRNQRAGGQSVVPLE